MSETVPIAQARAQLGDIVRRAAHGHETTALTDHGHVAALVVSPQVIEDYEDSIAILQYELRKARGETSGRRTQQEVRQLLTEGGMPA